MTPYFHENDDENCPYHAAFRHGLHVMDVPKLGEIMGCYFKISPTQRTVWLNEDIEDFDVKTETLEYLVDHHIKHDGVPKAIKENDLQKTSKLKAAVNSMKSVTTSVQNSRLGGSFFLATNE